MSFNIKKRYVFSFVGAALSILLGYNQWFAESSSLTSSSAQIKDDAVKLADYYFENVAIKQFASQGELINKVEAQKMMYFEERQISRLDQPKVQLKDTQSDWTLAASWATLDHKKSQLQFENNTHISQTSTSGNSTIKTPRLLLNLNKNTANSDEAVILETESSMTHAKGLTADFASQLITLKSNVETRGKHAAKK